MPATHRLLPALVLLCLLALLAFTAPASRAAGQGTLIAAAGDISCPARMTARYADEFKDPSFPTSELRCQGHRVAALIAEARPAYALALGDLIQSQRSTTQAYDDFDRTWGELDTKIMPTIGNHDYVRQSNGSYQPSGYFDYWQSKDLPRWRIGSRNRGWSSWDLGSWHMIDLNSNCSRIDCSFHGAQARWLLRDLKANRKGEKGPQCILAYLHHPLFSAGVPLGRTGDSTLLVNLWELLYRFRADVVVTGHQHFYERYLPQNPSGRSDPTGIAQFITGTGGASKFPLVGKGGRESPNSAAGVSRFGATFFTLGPDGYSWEFRDIRGGTFDRSEAETHCHGATDGGKLRRPRNDRYVAHMKRMGRLTAKKRRWRARVRRLVRHGAARGRVKASRARYRRVARIRAAYREQPLY